MREENDVDFRRVVLVVIGVIGGYVYWVLLYFWRFVRNKEIKIVRVWFGF